MLSALKKCFEEASKLKAGSVALPSMGLGAKGFPSKDVAAATLQAITEFTESNPLSSVTQVKLYLYKPALSANQLKVGLNASDCLLHFTFSFYLYFVRYPILNSHQKRIYDDFFVKLLSFKDQLCINSENIR